MSANWTVLDEKRVQILAILDLYFFTYLIVTATDSQFFLKIMAATVGFAYILTTDVVHYTFLKK